MCISNLVMLTRMFSHPHYYNVQQNVKQYQHISSNFPSTFDFLIGSMNLILKENTILGAKQQ